jgi:hypothetical protein
MKIKMNKITKLFALGAFAIGLTSCLDDMNIEDQKYGMINLDAYKIVELPSASRSFSQLLQDKAISLNVLTVHLAAGEVAQEDITVTLSTDQTAAQVAAYNTANKASVEAFPAGKYTLPTPLTVVIPKGSSEGTLALNFNAKDLDPAHPYALNFKITNVDKPGYTVSGNYNNTLVRISAKNAYEGTYKATGVFTHPTAGPRAIDRNKTVTTVNATTSRIEVGDLAGSGYYMYVQVNADNTVTILPDPTGATQDVFATGANTYDPATKTFTLNYAYNSAAPRRISETVKFTK